MLVGIHQPHYLPWLRYFEKIDACDVFILLDTVQYSKNGWQNRNKIKTPMGEQVLTVPVHAHLDERIVDVRIDDTHHWKTRHAKAIQQNYRGAVHFEPMWKLIAPCFDRNWDSLADLNRQMLSIWVELLGISTPLRLASELGATGDATERLVNLIQAVGGDAYYSGAYALETYLDSAALDSAGIELKLQTWNAPVYPQRYGNFLEDLSIVDLVANTGPDALGWVRKGGGRGD